ncbi:MAG: hypothetical protein ACRDRH_17825 [Pseudonocardia sp.]
MTQVADRPVATPGESRRRRRWGSAGAAIGIPTVLVGLHSLLYGNWIVDDSGITFAYARSIATGAGPVLQPGAEVVEGFSNPAWLALLVVGRWLGLFDGGAWFGVPDYVAFPKLLALMMIAAVFACFYAIASAVSRRPLLVAVIAGAVTAAVPSFVIWTMSGLENSLLALATTGIATVLVRATVADRLLAPSTAVGCGLLAALAALTRPDGLIYVAAFPLVALLFLGRGGLPRTLSAVAVSSAAFAVPAGTYLVWRLATFGEYLPNTAVAKSQGLPGAEALARPGELVGYIGWLATLLAVVCIGAALTQPWVARRGLVAVLVPLALGVAAFGVLEADWMAQLRFATPVWALGALAGTIAAFHVVPQLTDRGRAVVAVLAVVAAITSGLALADSARTFRANPTAPLCLVAQNTGRTMNAYAQILGIPNATLLAPDVGGAALTSNLKMIDLVGLADSRIAGYWSAGDMTGLRDHVFDRARPTFITSNGDWSRVTDLPTDPRLAADYAEINTSAAGVTDWVRRDALSPGVLGALRDASATWAKSADIAARRSPRASCGDRLAATAS